MGETIKVVARPGAWHIKKGLSSESSHVQFNVEKECHRCPQDAISNPKNCYHTLIQDKLVDLQDLVLLVKVDG